MLKLFLKFIGQVHQKRIRTLEKQIGYKLTFAGISKIWINGFVHVDLTKAWKKFGLNVTGVDYFTMGNLVNGISTRFDSQALPYQAWVGGYLVKLNEPKIYTIQDHLNLAVVDQMDWLRDYGDPNPICELHPSGFQKAGQINIGGYFGKVYIGGGISHSDVGNKGNFWLSFVGGYLATMFNLTNPALQLIARNFIPKPVTQAYSKVLLKGYIIILEIEKDTHAVLYANGTTDTFESIKDELMNTLKAIIITKI